MKIRPTHVSRRHACLLVAALAAAGLAGCGGGVPEVVKIGVGTTLSGSSANRGNDILNGVKLAAAELQKQNYKVDGKLVRFEVISVDDKGTAEGAKAAAQQLADQGVNVVFGHLSSDTTLAALPIYAAKKLPVVTTSSAKELTAQAEGNVFRLVANDADQARAMASYASSINASARAAVINEDTLYGKGVADDLATAAGKVKLNLVVRDKIDAKSRDFAAFAERLKAEKIDLVVAILREPQLMALAAAMKAAGHVDVTVLASNPAKTDKVAQAELPFKALYVTSNALDVRDFQQGSGFVTKFRATYNSDPVWAAHYAYDGMFAVADAIRSAKSVEPDALSKALRTIDPVTWVTQTMRFRADGEQANAAIGVYQVARGAWALKMSSATW